MTENDFELGDAELEVLKVLWEAGPCTVRAVMNHLHEAERRVAYTTVLTFLTRLEQKDYVASDKSELAYVYRAAISREDVSQSRTRTLLEQLYDGAAGPLVLQLIKNERLSRQEIVQLHALIERLDRKRKRT